MIISQLIFIVSVFIGQTISTSKNSYSPSLIVLPPFLKLNEENTITVINDKSFETTVIVEHDGEKFTKSLKDKIYQQVHFRLSSSHSDAVVKVLVNGTLEIERIIPVQPDLFNVHIHIDKTIYRKSEIVNARILPLTHSGHIYRKDLNIFLVNHEGFIETATMKTSRVDDNDPIISVQLEIPFHTFFGDWKLKVRPVDGEKNDEKYMLFEKEFEVQDYDLPNFRLSGFLRDSNKIEDTVITLEAKYFYGKPINGTVHIYCKEVGSTSIDRTHLIHVKSGEFDRGLWSESVNLTKCDPFRSPKEIFIESQESGTGQRQDMILNWDLNSPKFNMIPVRPYFTKDTTSITFMVDGEGVERGDIEVTLNKIPSGRTRAVPVTIEKVANVGDVITIEIPKEWRTTSSIIRVVAKRRISHGWTNETMIYIPNLSETSLGTTLINQETPKMFYKDGEIMNVIIKKDNYEANQMHYIIVCNSNTIHHVPSEVRNNVLRVKITEKMEGTCVLAAFSTNQKAADVLLFRVHVSCEDCQLKISKISDGNTKQLSTNDFLEPGDEVQLEYSGHSESIVFYRAMDERLNYIASKGDSHVRKFLDYLVFGSDAFGAQVLNFVNKTEVELAMEKVCRAAGNRLRLNCDQGLRSTSLFSEKCLKHVLYSCFAELNVKPLAVNNDIFGEPPQISKAGSPMWEFNDPGLLPKGTKVRQNFPETWLFDAVVLGKNGSRKILSQSPDNVGQWALSSAFWSSGQSSLYTMNTTFLKFQKSVYLELHIPRNVYVNETISPLLTISGVDLKKTKETFVICLSELPRKVCADEGANGKKGDAYYSKIELSTTKPVQSKYLMLKFLSPGVVNMTVTLRSTNCETGKIIDAVRKQIDIQKRADTEEYYGEHTIIPNKPIISSMKEEKMITFSDQRASNDDSDTINTLISSNIPDTETVYSFRITLAASRDPNKPLPNFIRRRIKRSGQRRLTNVIKDLSVALYSFKTEKLTGHTSYELESDINDFVNEMMQFSNCSSDKEPCGYYEFGRPQSTGSVSILLTSIATSLLCEAGVEDSRVIGSLRTILKYIPELNTKMFAEDLSDVIDVENIEDKKFILVSFMNQVSKDCMAYKPLVQEMSKSFRKLHKYFYDLDESNVTDRRIAGAIAFMATNATAEVMRSDLLSTMNTQQLPYWRCDGIQFMKHLKEVPEEENFRRRRDVSCQVMLNSFALSAVVTAYAEGNDVDWDKLADWISEQQKEDGSFGSSLNTLVASRSLYEKRRRALNIDYNQNLEVRVKCTGCLEKRINVTSNAVEIHIPTNVRYVTLTTIGKGRAIVTARIVATKRQRPKRGLTQDDYYPVHISIEQLVDHNYVHQTVCMNVTNPTIKTLDIFHGVYTSFHTSPDKLLFMNSTYLPVNPSVSSLGMHFYITEIVANQTICYKLAQVEANGGKIYPDKSAPVPIRATHPVLDLVGMILVAHPDVPQQDQPLRMRRHSTRTRFVRRIIDESAVDIVCYEKGECSCAETTCSVRCKQCKQDSLESVQSELSRPGFFGARFEVKSVSNSSVNGAMYTVYDGTVIDKKGSGTDVFNLKNLIRVWLRLCNFGCSPAKPENRHMLLIGHEDGLQFSDGRYNYVLNHNDRFEESTYDCQQLNSVITIKE